MEDEKLDEYAQEGNGRSPSLPLLLTGIVFVGIAFGLLIFGGNLFGDTEKEGVTILSESVLQFEEGGSLSQEIPQEVGFLERGDPATEFTLQDLEGNTVSLSDFRGQPVIVNFWATWCGPCRIEMPEFEATFQEYQEQGLVILAINQGEPAEKVEAFFYDDMGLTFTPLLDQEQAISAQYGVFNYPSTFFINSEGVVADKHLGVLLKPQLDQFMANLLEG